MDRSTIESLIARGKEFHSSLEALAREKKNAISDLNARLHQANVEIERVRGALDCNSITIQRLQNDLKTLDDMQAAAAHAAAEQAKVSAEQATQNSSQ